MRVKMGRFHNQPLEQRLCTRCCKTEGEHEYHFLCRCPAYHNLHRKLYSTAIYLYPEFEDKDILEKLVFLTGNLQKHVTVIITSAVFNDTRWY